MNKETVEESARGVARKFYGSLSRNRQVVSTGTCVILKPATWNKIMKNVRPICTAVGRDVRPSFGGSEVLWLERRKTAVLILIVYIDFIFYCNIPVRSSVYVCDEECHLLRHREPLLGESMYISKYTVITPSGTANYLAVSYIPLAILGLESCWWRFQSCQLSVLSFQLVPTFRKHVVLPSSE